MDYQSSSLWFNNFSKNIGAPYRLFVFPFAGGSSSIYRSWAARFPGIEVMAVCLPGRETRIEERPLDSMPALMQQLVPQIAPFLDRPFAFFGHSMGALMAFDLTRQLARSGLPQPDQLFLSAFHAPEHLSGRKTLHTLPDRDFLRHLIQYGGMPPAVLEAPELLRLMLPVMRADFSMIETFELGVFPPVSMEIISFCGSEDHAAPHQDMLGWRDHTAAAFSLTTLPGGHFFLKTAENQLLQLLATSLEQRSFMSASA